MTTAAAETTSQLIERPRLLAELDAAEARGVRAICLVAPAGYGKTVLAEQWVRSRHPNAIWHYATSASRDVQHLASGLARAAETACPAIGESLRRASSTGADAARVASAVVRELLKCANEPWLVIDDFELVAKSPSYQLLEEARRARACRLLLLSRSRPAFASARAVLYAEATVIDASALEFNPVEVEALVAALGSGVDPTLIPRWPVLARLAIQAPPETDASDDVLFSFIADEVVASLPRRVRADLARLAICPGLEVELVAAVLGRDWKRTMRELAGAGLVRRMGPQGFAMHPLVQAHVLERVDTSRDTRRIATRRAFAHLMRKRDFDAALSVAVRSGDVRLQRLAIGYGYETLLAEGRIATVAKWLDSLEPGDELGWLLRAELAVLQAEPAASLAYAEYATSATHRKPKHRIRAMQVGGLAAFLSGQRDRALELYGAAAAHARLPRTRSDALWGRFTALNTDVAGHGEKEFLAYEKAAPGDPKSIVRAAGGRLSLEIAGEYHVRGLAHARKAASIVHEVRDPLVRTSFFAAFADTLVEAGCVDEAKRVLSQLIRDAEDHGLAFVRPRALMIQARIDLLHRRFHRCQLDIDQALRLASHDPDLTQSCEITGALMALAAGKRRSPHDDLPLIVPQSYLASSASAARHLIAAIWSDEPIKIVHEAEVPVGTSDHTTIQHVTDLARAIAWHRATDGSSAPQRDGVSLDTAVEMCVAHGDIFAFVVAYRGFPNLIDVALANPRIADRATAAVASLDRDLAFRHGIAPSPPEPFAGGDLSPRERDVLKLLTEGLTNREIGRRLFISESTAKLHVRRICLKLGVRTRTEAALLAVS